MVDVSVRKEPLMSQDPPTPSQRRRFSRSPAAWIAGTSDIGSKHRTNQDAMCLAVREQPAPVAVIAVSDGVSTARGSEIASLVASEAAVASLTESVSQRQDPSIAFTEAFQAAHDAVLQAADDPSACTLIAAIMAPDGITVGNVGDSRAYWISDSSTSYLLSTDDSMAQARIMLGMDRHTAENSPQAHSITKWLGRDATDITPSVVAYQPTTHGWLLLCSDGLWNYASSVEEMHQLITGTLAEHPDTEAATQALADWANEQGGRDNITVVLARYQGKTLEAETT